MSTSAAPTPDATATATATSYVDVLIVGAGLSGIGAACHLHTEAPGTSYAIVEARGVNGGTWELFRYPGIRSDSDMFTLGYPFRPWTGTEAIADGAAILRYLRETAVEYGVDRHIRYYRRVVAAAWSSADARWSVTVQDTESGEQCTQTCGFLYLCSGYYRYDQGYLPTWPGQSDFTGVVVHPQHWPTDLDLTGKRVVVIGSGATAVSLIPAVARDAAHVTMLQRSPSYIMSLPADPLATLLRMVLPRHRASAALRWKNMRMSTAVYRFCRKHPALARRMLLRGVRKQLPIGYDVDTHFGPRYAPWDQRLCLAPDGDLFAAIRSGAASVVTDSIASFTPDGLRLRSGALLPADVVVTATGLELLPFGGIELRVDDEPVVVAERVAYKGMMLDGVPNVAFALGYTNASWTLKVDLVSGYVGRLVRHLAEHGYAMVTPRLPAGPRPTAPFIEMTSGYFERARTTMLRQGDAAPWRLQQDYVLDAPLFRGPVADEPGLEFRPGRPNSTGAPPRGGTTVAARTAGVVAGTKSALRPAIGG